MSHYRATIGLALGLALSASMPIGSTARAQDASGASGWGRVLTVTDEWLVVENARGQQFPVRLDAVNLFVMRWPTSPDRLLPQDLVEASGVEVGSNQLSTDHADVFTGSARSMVTPTFQPLPNIGRRFTQYDDPMRYIFGIHPYYVVNPVAGYVQRPLHVVGPPANGVPLQIGIGSNNVMTVVPSAGFTLTQVTEGVPRFVAPGDVAHLVPVPERATPRSLAIAELVVYKSVPFDQFGP